MTLYNASKGSKIRILNIRDKNIRFLAIRIGIYEGAMFICSEKLPGGPIILQSGRQEIAVGKRLAENIVIDGGEL